MHEPIRRFWYADKPAITAFFNGLSVSIPEIEYFIAGTVRAAAPHAKDPDLKKAIETIIHEEEAHAKVHSAYNLMLKKQGYSIDRFEKTEHAIAEFFNKRSLKTRLAVCLCSEFFTAVMGRHVLKDAALEAPGVDERMRALWTWHSLEELHHRSTAFDLYIDHGGGYFRRTFLMLFMTLRWLVSHVRTSLSILAQGKVHMNPRDMWEGLMFVVGPNGFYTNIIPSLFLFFKPGFHPRSDIRPDRALDLELHHYHIEKHFAEMIEGSSY